MEGWYIMVFLLTNKDEYVERLGLALGICEGITGNSTHGRSGNLSKRGRGSSHPTAGNRRRRGQCNHLSQESVLRNNHSAQQLAGLEFSTCQCSRFDVSWEAA